MENEYLSNLRNWWSDLHYSSLQKRGLAIIACLVIISALFVLRGSSQEVIAAPAPLEIESIAATFRSKDFTLFAAGDIEPPVQSLLRSRIGKVDIYKVAHHGSRYQDLDLMRELAPAVAIISVGAENSYGHPAPSTISALTDLHAKVLRTDIDGAVAIRAERHRLSIQRSKRWLRIFFWS
jgi:beta-lactamase superfamily II metal-dependent hydrolase